jgi:16S rRNA (cytidine1402-2'-O)-methyltransferase
MLGELGDRKLTLCRELTKMHVEVRRTSVSAALARFRAGEALGEFTLAVEGKPRPASEPELEP